MQQTLRLTKWEWFKLRRLRMPWILLAVALLISQLGIWTNYLAYHSDATYELLSGGNSSFGISLDEWEGVAVSVTCVDIARGRAPTGLDQLADEERRFAQERIDEWLSDGACDNTKAIEEIREGFTLPSSITTSTSGFASLGPIAIGPLLLMILAATLIASEFGWGTMRTVLSGGISRWQFLSAKVLLMVWLCCGVLVIISLVAVLSSLTAVFASPVDASGVADSGKWSDIVTVFFRTVYGLLPFIGLSIFTTVLTSSRSLGIALSVGYFIVETIAAPILRLNNTLARIEDYLLIQSFRSWTAVPLVEDTSDLLRAFVVILAYTALFIAIAAWVFKRRDIGGATGD